MLNATAQSLPAGWRERPRTAQTAERIYEAIDLPADQSLSIRESTLQALDGASLSAWLASVAAADPAPQGSWATEAAPSAKASMIATVSREFATALGRGAVVFTAVSTDDKVARVWRITFSSVALLGAPQGRAAKQLMTELAASEITNAKSGARRDTAPPTVTAKAVPTPDLTPAPEIVIAPGGGLKLDQLETVYYHWQQRFDGFQGLVMDEGVYLLLKDGTAYSGFPAAFEAFDVAASRQKEVGQWGQWRKTAGKYTFSWRSDEGRFRGTQGNPVPPAPKGSTVNGLFKSGSTYKFPGSGLNFTFMSNVQFTAAGRFDADGETRGRYRIEGYNIELTHDNGKVERRPFFIDGEGIWFQGGWMFRSK
jgi:hypothetical protein